LNKKNVQAGLVTPSSLHVDPNETQSELIATLLPNGKVFVEISDMKDSDSLMAMLYRVYAMAGNSSMGL
jgi:hypothetical protein